MKNAIFSPSCLSLGINRTGRDFVVGDIHGHFELVEALMRTVDFDPARDRLCAVGDLVDRGPTSHQVLDWLKQPWFFSVRGNHEQMILDAEASGGDDEGHRNNGGAWFYDSAQALRATIADALKALPFAMEIQLADRRKVGIVHAKPPLLDGQNDWGQALTNLSGTEDGERRRLAQRQALYSRSRFNSRNSQAVTGVDCVYVGHTSVPTPTCLGNVMYLDTGCSWSDGRLSAIEVSTGAIISVDYA